MSGVCAGRRGGRKGCRAGTGGGGGTGARAGEGAGSGGSGARPYRRLGRSRERTIQETEASEWQGPGAGSRLRNGSSFGIPDGLADHHRVTVLDFACGTGTFLLEVFERVFEQIGGADSGHADLIVREHLLRNIYGFEYLIAPYTIAHLKLSQYLKDKGHVLAGDDRLKVFLTNTLEPIEPQRNLLLPAVSGEVEAAQRVKDQPILVITGNPPYSGHSKNKGKWIKEQIGGYKITIEEDESGTETEKPLGERNPKWLNDDYVKFIRFAQLKMDKIDEGIVGIITNHSWLDNPTFRGMRQSLTRTFDQIYILDLHGSTKPREITPDQMENENVFDITKGVCISLLIKNSNLPKGIWYSEIWGSRLEKYQFVANFDFPDVAWQEVGCIPPYYFLAQFVNRMRHLVTAAARQARSLAPGARPTRWNQLR